VNFEALLLFGSGLNHLSILSGNHVSCGDLHLVDHYSWIRIVIASISVYFHPFFLLFYPITKISYQEGTALSLRRVFDFSHSTLPKHIRIK
jgi:hypothetical protein